MDAKSRKLLSIYTLSHFCVDFACFFMLFSVYADKAGFLEEMTLGFLLYNTIAFGTQPIIGFVCDQFRKIPIGAIGCALLLTGLLLTKNLWWVQIVVMGLGNACFHIGAGISALRRSGGKLTPVGIFVSTGALGVPLGMLAGKANIPALIPIILLAVCFVLIAVFDHKPSTVAARFNIVNPARSFGAVILLAFLSIVIRSYAGGIIPMEWKTAAFLTVLPGAFALLGKASGGFLADCFGAKRVGVISLLASAALLSLGPASAVLCLTGIALFNMSMSITLCAITSQMPQNPGLAFGTTTLALLLGSYPTFFFTLPTDVSVMIIAALPLASAATLYFILAKKNKTVEE